MKLSDIMKGKRPLTKKAKMYIDGAKSINEAFNDAKCEDFATLNSIYNEGVDINFDVDAQNEMNMFKWSITGHNVCSPDFLELMFTKGRSDIPKLGQHLFESACERGDPRHIEVFMKRNEEYKWNLFEGMKSAVNGDNRTNFHHLLMYENLDDFQTDELWNRACGDYIHGYQVMLYMNFYFNCTVSQERMSSCIVLRFNDTLHAMMTLYLKDNKPFKIDNDMVLKILGSTEDRISKLKLLDKYGFEIEGLEKILATDENDLPKPSCRRYITMLY